MLTFIVSLMLAQPDVDAALALSAAKYAPKHSHGYEYAFNRAKENNSPLVIFVDCKEPPVGMNFPAGYQIHEASAGEWFGLTRKTERGVVVSVDGWRGKILPPSSSWAQIRAEVYRLQGEGVRQAPRPFYRERLLYGEEAAEGEPDGHRVWPKGVPWIQGLVRYEPAKLTQSVSNGTQINAVPRSGLLRKWHAGVPGGMEGIQGYRSDLYKLLPERESVWRQRVMVENGIRNYNTGVGFFTQPETALRRSYPDGTLFIDLLSCDGKPFEGRAREKTGDTWHSYVFFRDKAARPPGYQGLQGKTCISCHSEAGTGGYNVGFVPGGDFTLSDPIAGLEQ